MTAHPVGCGCAECQNPNLVKLVFRGKPTQNRAELYEGYSRQFRRAADSVFADNEQPELADRLRANVSRFAAYKSAYVEGEFARIANDPKYNDATRKAAMNAAEDRFARWTDAEYNTATARCRTAKQMAEFMEPDNVRLFPNLEWLATRSANPRAEHQAFVGLILPKEDDFWKTHTPGTEWNCKCDLAETDAPASNADNLPDIKPPRGLEGNPYHTGEVFTDKVGYIRNARISAEDANIMGRNNYRKYRPTDYSFSIGNEPIDVNKILFKETAKASTDQINYFLKNEICRHLGRYVEAKDEINPELINNHNVPGSKTYRLKNKLSIMRVFSFTVNGVNMVLMVGVYKNTGKLVAYTCYVV